MLFKKPKYLCTACTIECRCLLVSRLHIFKWEKLYCTIKQNQIIILSELDGVVLLGGSQTTNPLLMVNYYNCQDNILVWLFFFPTVFSYGLHYKQNKNPKVTVNCFLSVKF